MNKNLLRLAKAILRLASAETDKGVITYEGELTEGTEVYLEDENGELVPAADGEYVIEAEGKILVVAEGKVVEVKEIEKPEEETTEETTEETVEETLEEETETEEPDERDARIAELEARIAELEAIIAERDAEIASLKDKNEEQEEMLRKSVEKLASEKKNVKGDKYASMSKYLK